MIVISKKNVDIWLTSECFTVNFDSLSTNLVTAVSYIQIRIEGVTVFQGKIERLYSLSCTVPYMPTALRCLVYAPTPQNRLYIF